MLAWLGEAAACCTRAPMAFWEPLVCLFHEETCNRRGGNQD